MRLKIKLYHATELYPDASCSFFLSWMAKTQLKHWNEQMQSTELIMYDPRNCPRLTIADLVYGRPGC